MRLNSAPVSIFLFISAVLSSPLREKDQPWFPNRVMLESTNGTSNEGYGSGRFAGAYWEETDGQFTFATATFNALAPLGQHGYTVYVGIDTMTTCHGSWLAAGIHAFVTDNSETSYTAWYEWGNDGPHFSDLTISPQDVIGASITALSATSGVVIIKNLNDSQTAVHYLHPTRSLCKRDVSWGVVPRQANASIPFDTVTITNATAYGPASIYEAEGANKVFFLQGNKAVTSVGTEGSTITIQHAHV